MEGFHTLNHFSSRQNTSSSIVARMKLGTDTNSVVRKIIRRSGHLPRVSAAMGNIAAGFQGNTEIALENIAEINKELLINRLIQVEALFQYLLDCGIAGLFLGEGAAGDRIHCEKGNCGDNKYGDDRQQYTLNDVFCHFSSTFLAASSMRLLCIIILVTIVLYPLFCTRSIT